MINDATISELGFCTASNGASCHAETTGLRRDQTETSRSLEHVTTGPRDACVSGSPFHGRCSPLPLTGCEWIGGGR